LRKNKHNQWQPLEKGAIVLSLDAELLWGHLDIYSEKRFSSRYPNAMASYDHVLRSLCQAGVSATWLVVGGMALEGSRGAVDPRLSGLPEQWTRLIPRGNEMTAPLWYRRSFIRQLANAAVPQDIGLHGGLSHMIWTDPHSTQSAMRTEMQAGLAALRELGIQPAAFSFPRNLERYHSLVAEGGFRCYRGTAPVLSEKLGRNLPGALVRLFNELGRSAPPLVFPRQKLPGLWNIPASLFLYPIGDRRSRIVAHESRIARVQKGIDAAIRNRGIFHFCLHPVNLAESSRGSRLFDSILERIARARESGDAAVLTMAGLAGHMQALAETADVRAGNESALSGQMIAGEY
jgi:peptidoglycan/xylan/chitin deacetylase (PgdA/CDA1 family)